MDRAFPPRDLTAAERLLRHGVTVLLDGWFSTRFRIEVRGLEHHTGAPATLVTANHRRDSDVPILTGALARRRGLRLRRPVPRFVAREDLFRRGFFAAYLSAWPTPLRAAFADVDLSPVLSALGAHPIFRPQEQNLRAVLEDVLEHLGDLPLEEVLRPEMLQRFEARAAHLRRALTVRDAFERRYRPLLLERQGLRRLRRATFAALKPYEQAVVATQLQVFVDILDRGGLLLLEPEGVLSRDGSFGRVRSGLHPLVNRPTREVRVLPVSLTYDFMTLRRPRVFLNVGPEITGLRGLSPAQTNDRVGRAIRALGTVTASQLASREMGHLQSKPGGSFTVRELADAIGEAAGRYAAAGLYVDPRLLEERRRGCRIDDYLGYLKKEGFVERFRNRYRVRDAAARSETSLDGLRGEMTYALNELNALAALLPSGACRP